MWGVRREYLRWEIRSTGRLGRKEEINKVGVTE
jgi:hypothetical protein